MKKLFFFLIGLSIAAPVFSATWFVDKTATSSTNAGTAANPWNSFRKIVTATFAAGDTIKFVAGTSSQTNPYTGYTGTKVALANASIQFMSGSPCVIGNWSSFDFTNVANTALAAGNKFAIMGSASNDGQYTVGSVTASSITLVTGGTCVDESSGASKSVDVVNLSVGTPYVFTLRKNGNTAAGQITWNFNGNWVSAMVTLTDASKYAWVASTIAANVYYVTKADGSDPGLANPGSVVTNGNYWTASAQDGNHNEAVGLGANSFKFDGQFGYGTADSQPANTIYVRADSGNPITSGAYTIWASQVAAIANENFNNIKITSGNFMGGGTPISGTSGQNFDVRGDTWTFVNDTFMFATNHALGLDGSAAYQNTIIDNCLSYWSGHRFVSVSGNLSHGVMTNNMDWGSHLCALINGGVSITSLISETSGDGTFTSTATTSGSHGWVVGDTVTVQGAAQTAYDITAVVTSTPSASKFSYKIAQSTTATATGTITACNSKTGLTMYNTVSANGEAGAIDKVTVGSTLIEKGNIWYPRMTASGGALGYTDSAVWLTTDNTDIPASMATTTSSQASLTDPQVANVSNTSFTGSDFHLNYTSPALLNGMPVGFFFVDLEGNSYPAAYGAVNRGPYAYEFGAGPTKSASRHFTIGTRTSLR